MSNGPSAVAFWLAEPGRGELRQELLAPLAAGEVEVATLYSGISRGTESLVFRGQVPATESQRMRAPFQQGEFPAPVKYGYINVGRVEAVAGEGIEPAAVRDAADLLGKPVVCLYPHQSRYRVPAAAVYPLPAQVPPTRAVLAAQLETAVNAMWDAEPSLGDRIAVVGAGTLGCLCAWLAGRIPGCAVQLIDVNPSRAQTARALAVDFALPEQAEPEADLVLHTSGTSEGLKTALALAGFEARVTELSWFGSQPARLPLGEAFHARRLTLGSSQVGQLPARQRARWSHRRRMELALSLLDAPELDQLITGESPFNDLPTLMKQLATAPGDVLMHRVRYDASANRLAAAAAIRPV